MTNEKEEEEKIRNIYKTGFDDGALFILKKFRLMGLVSRHKRASRKEDKG